MAYVRGRSGASFPDFPRVDSAQVATTNSVGRFSDRLRANGFKGRYHLDSNGLRLH